jgi:hypothetical protein
VTKHRWRRAIVAAVLALCSLTGTLAVSTAPAGATPAQNQDWWMGMGWVNSYNTASYCGAGGIHLYGQNTGHYYLAVPRHLIETGGWGGVTGGDPFCNVYMADWNNSFGTNDIYFPWCDAACSGGIDFTRYDTALIDLGTGSLASSIKTKNWCKPYPNCAGPQGGGTGAGSYTSGTLMNNTGNAGSGWVGESVCKSAPVSGTACGTVQYAQNVSYDGYTSWQWITTAGNCGAARGDSGGHVFYTADSGVTTLMAGVITTVSNPGTTGAQTACYGANRPGVSTNGLFGWIPWTSWASGFPTVGLIPVT